MNESRSKANMMLAKKTTASKYRMLAGNQRLKIDCMFIDQRNSSRIHRRQI